MAKINYELKMQEQLKNLGEGKGKLLLHACCGPCSSAVMEFLQDYFQMDIYFYNPNITEEKEYHDRLEELYHFIDRAHFPVGVLEGKYQVKEDFFEKIKGLEGAREGGERCKVCYELRMREAAKKAKEEGYDYFTTVLSISPMKRSAWINEIGEALEEEYGIPYLRADFKKKGRYLRSIELSKQYDLYRQEYCGCIFSKLEQDKKRREKEEREKEEKAKEREANV